MKKKRSTKAQRRKWRIEARERDRAKHDRALFARNLKRLYKITPEQFEAMLAAQDGKCAICGGTPLGTKRYQRGSLSITTTKPAAFGRYSAISAISE